MRRTSATDSAPCRFLLSCSVSHDYDIKIVKPPRGRGLVRGRSCPLPSHERCIQTMQYARKQVYTCARNAPLLNPHAYTCDSMMDGYSVRRCSARLRIKSASSLHVINNERFLCSIAPKIIYEWVDLRIHQPSCSLLLGLEICQKYHSIYYQTQDLFIAFVFV